MGRAKQTIERRITYIFQSVRIEDAH